MSDPPSLSTYVQGPPCICDQGRISILSDAHFGSQRLTGRWILQQLCLIPPEVHPRSEEHNLPRTVLRTIFTPCASRSHSTPIRAWESRGQRPAFSAHRNKRRGISETTSQHREQCAGMPREPGRAPLLPGTTETLVAAGKPRWAGMPAAHPRSGLSTGTTTPATPAGDPQPVGTPLGRRREPS